MARKGARRQTPGRSPATLRTGGSDGATGTPGWRVTPAPDGRGGASPAPTPPRPNARWLVVLMVIGLLALNLWISSQALQPAARVQIPYSPTFLHQVQSSNVGSISSTGESIQGTFKHAIAYSSTGKAAQPTTLFATQIPSFANNNELFQLLAKYGVTINAHPVQTSPSLISELLFGFGPTILLVLLFVFLMRRAAAAGGAGGLMSFGRSRARRVEGQEQQITFADVAGIDEAKEELTEIVDF